MITDFSFSERLDAKKRDQTVCAGAECYASTIYQGEEGGHTKKGEERERTNTQKAAEGKDLEVGDGRVNRLGLDSRTGLEARLSPFLQPDRLDRDEAGRRGRVKVSDRVHRDLLGVVQGLGLGHATLDDDVAEDEGESDAAVDRLLRLGEARLDKLALGGEPVAWIGGESVGASVHGALLFTLNETYMRRQQHVPL